MTSKLTYEKPELSFWTAEELDAIEATMSGGGGGGTGYRLRWQDKWFIDGSEGDYSLEIGIVAGVVTVIATKNLPFSAQVGAAVASAIAVWFVSRGFPIIYFKRYIQHLHMYVGTTGGGYEVWDLVGTAVRTEYYGNPDFTSFAGAIEFDTVPSMFSYMLSSLRW
jgi:hypothetical protein